MAIHLEFIPTGELMSHEQKKRDNNLPMGDVLQEFTVQLSADVLSVIFKRTGWGSSIIFVVDITWVAAM